MRNFYVKIGNGKSVSTFDIYWDIINPSNYATLFGSTTSATDISYSQMKSYPGVLVEVPDSAASIIVNSSQPTFCQGFGTSTTVYSYNLGTSSCIVPILTSATQNPNDTVTYVWNVGGFDYGTGTTLLEYSINSGSSWVNVGTVAPNEPSATSSVISVSYGTPIQYRVVCYGNGCSGMISNVISSTFNAVAPVYNNTCYPGSIRYSMTIPVSEDISNIGVEYYPSDPGLNAIERVPLMNMDVEYQRITLDYATYYLCSISNPNIYLISSNELILWTYSFTPVSAYSFGVLEGNIVCNNGLQFANGNPVTLYSDGSTTSLAYGTVLYINDSLTTLAPYAAIKDGVDLYELTDGVIDLVTVVGNPC